MHELRELQRGFSQSVFSDGDAPVPTWIRANGLSGARRLQIYRNNTYLNLTSALRSTYPVIEQLVGEGFFRYAAHQYITHYPSTAGNLHEFGTLFADFLSTFEPTAEMGYLPDIARLEWCYEQVYFAPWQPPLNPQFLESVPPAHYDALHFTFNPACRLLASDYPILHIWQVNQTDYTGDRTVNLDDGGARLLLIRNHTLDVEIQSLEPGEFTLLQTLAEGHDFATACTQALEIQPDYDLPVSFRRHLLQGTWVSYTNSS
ncbi:MAG: DNA-binding domain-containing protein [Candidatus Competibacteraceae bacterium]